MESCLEAGSKNGEMDRSFTESDAVSEYSHSRNNSVPGGNPIRCYSRAGCRHGHIYSPVFLFPDSQRCAFFVPVRRCKQACRPRQWKDA